MPTFLCIALMSATSAFLQKYKFSPPFVGAGGAFPLKPIITLVTPVARAIAYFRGLCPAKILNPGILAPGSGVPFGVRAGNR